MKSIALVIIYIYFTLNVFGQVELNSTKVNLTNPIDLEDYLKKPALNSKLIGLGEATHGTKEFSDIKSEIIKILIVKYHYKYFILEASFNDCIKINDFIHSKNNDTLNLFKGLPWPWATTEFYDLLKWMRDYNIHSNTNESIHFFGSDVGNIGSVRFYKNQFSDTTAQLFVKKLMDIYADSLKTSKQKLALLKLQSKVIPPMANFTDSIKMKNILETLNVLLLNGGKSYGYREITFANLTKTIIDHFPPDAKFVIWAHNIHVAKYSDSRKTLGYYLNKHYSINYTNFIFEFNKGGFRAVDIDSNRYQNKIFKLTNFYINSDKSKIGSRIMNDSFNYLIIEVKSPFNNKFVQRSFYINSIGAVYSVELSNKKPALYRDKIYRNKTCDFLIVVNQTNPSNNFYK
jgi:erythromycin esterase